MNKLRTLSVMLTAIACVAGAQRADAQMDRWRLRISGVSATPASRDGDTALGGALALEYRFSPRLGVEIGGLRVEPEEAVDHSLITIQPLSIDSTYRMTPLLARLNFHLTPGRRLDLYAGPVAGYVDFSDVDVHFHSGSFCSPAPTCLPPPPSTSTVRAEAEDPWVWGAGLGADVPLGRGGSFVSVGATYLRLPFDAREGDFTIQGAAIEPLGAAGVLRLDRGRLRGDVDPLLLHVGYGLRF
jgi:hypothetical protein